MVRTGTAARHQDLNTHRVPPNVRFEVDDVEADWTYHQKFDYIHCRFMGIAIKDWPKLVRQCNEYASQNEIHAIRNRIRPCPITDIFVLLEICSLVVTPSSSISMLSGPRPMAL